MTCFDDGILRSCLDGELAGTELAEVDQHLASCADCRVRFEKLSAETASARDLLASRRFDRHGSKGKARHLRLPWLAGLLDHVQVIENPQFHDDRLRVHSIGTLDETNLDCYAERSYRRSHGRRFDHLEISRH